MAGHCQHPGLLEHSSVCCSKITEAEAAVSVNKKKCSVWFVGAGLLGLVTQNATSNVQQLCG